METTTQHGAIEGKTQDHLVNFYSLDAIIAVGYRVNSARATQFRIWATKVLEEFRDRLREEERRASLTELERDLRELEDGDEGCESNRS